MLRFPAFASVSAPARKTGASAMAAWLERRPPPTRMQQCLTLALLLHVLLVLVFGNTQGGTAREGEGVWGRINVTLRGPLLEAGSGEPGATAPQQTGPVGQARQTRHGGSVRPELPREAGPGAARLGDWNPTPATQPVEQSGQDQARPVEASTATTLPTPSPSPSPTPRAEPLPEPMALPTPEPIPLPEPLTPRALARLPDAAAPVSRARPETIPLSSAAPAVIANLPVQAPVAYVPPVQTRSLPAASSSLSRAAPQDVSAAKPLPNPAQAVQPLPAFEPVTAPIRERQLAVPSRPALTPLPKSEALTPLPAQPAPAEAAAALPQLPVAPLSQATLGSVPSTAISDSKAEAAATASPGKPSPQSADSTPARSPDAGAQTQAKPSSSPNNPVQAPSAPSNGGSAAPGSAATPAASSRPGQGAPDAGAQLGHDVATPASTPADAPRLNLNLPRDMRGGALPSRSSSGLLNMVPPPPERKSKLEESMEAAGKKDCRKAYGEQLGLLAVIPLAADAVRKNGCKW